MFTGIIEEVGVLLKKEEGKNSGILTIGADVVLEGTKIGDSIAVNGVCLTVTEMGKDSFKADVMAETMRMSTLSKLKPKGLVNLERAMAADGRFGGHLVAGHIDGVGEIVKIQEEENAIWYEIHAEPSIMQYIVRKGSIAVDGISLTVARENGSGFAVSVIPHSRKITNLSEKKVGDEVNLECDIVGKYLEKFMQKPEESKITKGFLAENGYL